MVRAKAPTEHPGGSNSYSTTTADVQEASVNSPLPVVRMLLANSFQIEEEKRQ